MMRATLMMSAVLLAAGCAAIDRPELSRFEPLAVEGGVRTFKFTARADAYVYPVDRPEGETQRMRWLDMYMAENAFCPRGYAIDSRDAVAVSTGLGTVHDVYYRGRCRP